MVPRLWNFDKFKLHVYLFLKILLPDPALILVFIVVLNLPARRRWILGHGIKLAVMKCLQSSEDIVSLGGAIGRAIDKGMEDGLPTGIDHGKARRSLAKVAAYDLIAEANMDDIMGLLHLKGLATEIPEAS
nr:hypothetical protein [Tanacetum cinerariifolium]